MFLMAWVTAATNLLKVTFNDAAGRASTVGIYVDDSETSLTTGGPAALVTGFAGISDALISKSELLMYAKDDAPGNPETDAYDRPTDKLQLKLSADSGIAATITLPSLKEAYYQSDKTRPLTGAGPAKTLLDLIKANCVTADGQPLTSIKSARRMVPRGLKTWNKKGSI